MKPPQVQIPNLDSVALAHAISIAAGAFNASLQRRGSRDGSDGSADGSGGGSIGAFNATIQRPRGNDTHEEVTHRGACIAMMKESFEGPPSL